MSENGKTTRRGFLGFAGAALLAAGCSGAAARGEAGGEKEAEVTPTEDLMREHGVLNRVLLVYEEGIRRLDAGEDLPPAAIVRAAGIVKTFIEDYHERTEENHVFPRFEKTGRLADLTRVLRAQHDAGRRVTSWILTAALGARTPDDRKKLAAALRSFVRMYRPHEAREDTVLFPALRAIVTPAEFQEMGERFEDEEKSKLGEDGFERFVAEVGEVEKTLGIFDLSQFTPR